MLSYSAVTPATANTNAGDFYHDMSCNNNNTHHHHHACHATEESYAYGADYSYDEYAGEFNAHHMMMPNNFHQHKPILAERFKTKICKNFMECGSCPYYFRCMFAHGEHELRTKQMNMADGLYTEEAIKAFKRANYEAEKRRQAEEAAYALQMAASAYWDECSSSSSMTPRGSVSATPKAYRHDPYAERSQWHPLNSKTNSKTSSKSSQSSTPANVKHAPVHYGMTTYNLA